ncbi:MAG: carboxylesterase/lipase family protein [Halioglobus sp.]
MVIPRLIALLILSWIIVGCGGGSSSNSNNPEVVPPPSAEPPPETPPSPDTVSTQCGSFQGRVEQGVVAFKGIPYARPPVGELRWQPPAQPECGEAVQTAFDFAPSCAQFDREGDIASLAEDCLYLNVWTPDAQFPAIGERPVLVFIHGGGNQMGSPSQVQLGLNLYDGAALAVKTDSVVVTLAYRLGALGYLAHPALSAEHPQGRSGNYGLQDQLTALHWVQANIARFGGDTEQVAIFGESAGSRNVCSLVASPLASGLFSAAIMQSGGCRQQSLADAEAEGITVASAAGCDSASDASCLRALPVDTLLNALGPEVTSGAFVGKNIGPIADGEILPGSPDELIAAGAHNQVPLIIGANAEETRHWIGASITESEYRALVYAQFGTNFGNQVLAQYPVAAYESAAAAYTALSTDSQFICPARRVAQSAALSSQPVYVYRFARSFESTPLQRLGAFHGIELFYIFQKVSELESYPASDTDRAVETTMAQYWSSFARSGNPNGTDITSADTWEPYSTASDRVLLIDSTASQVAEPRAEQCAFWASPNSF